MSFRKSAIVLLIILVFASGAYTGYWFYARETAARIIENWTAQRRAEGYDISFDMPRFDGYPLLIRASLGEPRLRHGDFAWRGEGLAVEFQPWNFQRIRIDLQGKQWLALEPNARPMLLTPSEAAIVARLSNRGQLKDATLLLRNIQLSDPDGVSLLQAAEIWLEADAPEIPPREHTDKALALSLAAADIVLPETADGPLGRTVATLRTDMQVNGVIVNGTIHEAVEAWRRSGGTVDVDWFHLVWGEFDLRAKGTMALDELARPLGAFSTDIRGQNQALDALVARALLEERTATLAKIGLALLSKSPPEGGAPVLTVPVTAQDGHLYAGPVRILDLSPIRLSALPR